MNDQSPTSIKSLTFHFSNGEIFVVPMEVYTFKLDAAGIFVTERVSKHKEILTPNEEYRTVKFIQMVNVNWIDFEYYGDE